MVVEDPASAALPRRWQQSATTAQKTIGGEEVEDFGLGASALRVDSHHLPSSGQDTREKGHLGPRHAIREAEVRTGGPCLRHSSPPQRK